MLLPKTVTKAFYNAYSDEQPLADRLAGTFDLLRYGYIDNARDMVEKLKVTEPNVARVKWLAHASERAEIRHQNGVGPINGAESVMVSGLPEPIKVRPPTDVMVIRAEKAEQVLIAFGGASESFWVPSPFLELSDCHVIVLRDARRLFHFCGVEGLGANYSDCLQGLKTLVGDLGANKVFFAGSSSGGYAALRYALDFEGVRGVLAISPFTGSTDIPKEATRFPALRPVMRQNPGMLVDLVPLYRQHPNPPKLILVWGDRHVVDNEQANRMKGLRMSSSSRCADFPITRYG